MLSAEFCALSQSEKNAKIVARANPKFHQSGDDWPPSSPHINPLDYKCGLCWRNMPAPGGTKISTHRQAVREIPLAMIRESINDWLKRLQRCEQTKADHFE